MNSPPDLIGTFQSSVAILSPHLYLFDTEIEVDGDAEEVRIWFR